MSIHIYTGVPGSGKSLHAASDIRFELTRRYPRLVIANFPLASSAPIPDSARSLYVHLPNEQMTASAIIDIAQDYWSKADAEFAEDHILLVLDEAQLLFNSRLWSAKDRMEYLSLMSQSRKHGIKVLLIAQASKMIDNQFRMLIEVEHNHRKITSLGPVGWMVTRPFGGRLFLVVRTLYQINEKLGMSLFRGTKRDMAMYDSYGTFAKV